MIQYDLKNLIFVNRVHHIKMLCQGKRVLHLGATDSPLTKQAIFKGRLLHQEIEDVAKSVVGMDLDAEMIQWLAENHNIHNIKYGNIERIEHYPNEEFDIVVAGEIFEHLSNPGKALESLQKVLISGTKLVITVPNAYSFKGFFRASLKHELIHPDHTLHHSPHTLKALLSRHGFATEQCFGYVNGGAGIFASCANALIRFNPQLAEGIGVVCSAKN
jgi:2-polyprenyl-3-methyl-5-hydroxy-6-metoxy-1,4-benzoquinol methylase